jgi:non-heme Fe2+,alpha-ketoglutarate-dependent halogenase
VLGHLSPEQVVAFRRDGILFPIRVISETEASNALMRLEALEAREGGSLSTATNQKIHLLVPWLNDLVRNPAILDAVESILGPDILCWGSGFFAKNPNDAKYISWHQDSTYWDLSSSDVLTAWLALTPSTPENGCLQVVPGSHLLNQIPHRDTFAPGNLLSRGQEIAVEVDRSKAVDVVLKPGEISLHHVRIFHASEPNRGTGRRVGYSIRYIPTYVRQTTGRISASLVRGVDSYHHFEPEPIPAVAFDPAAVASHQHALDLLFADPQ